MKSFTRFVPAHGSAMSGKVNFTQKVLLSFLILVGGVKGFAQTNFAVPNVVGVSGCNGVILSLTGGGGGGGASLSSTGGSGGTGGNVVCTLYVNTPGPTTVTQLTYQAGTGGTGGTTVNTATGVAGGAGYGTGGNGGAFAAANANNAHGGGGGGSSAVWISAPGTTVLAVAAGGGGGGGSSLTTGCGSNGNPGNGGNAGNGGAAGASATSWSSGNGGGSGGGIGIFGAGGGAGQNGAGSAAGGAAPGVGGAGGTAAAQGGSGGGGGGGYGGGGGAGGGTFNTCGGYAGGGGGGGSNFVNGTYVGTTSTNNATGGAGGGAQTTGTSGTAAVPVLYPTLATAGSVSFCVGGNTSFSAGVPSGGTWSTSAGSIATISSSSGASITVTGVAAGTANITYHIPGGFWSFRTVTVQGPTVNIGAAVAAICQGGTTAPLGASVGGSATGGVWSDGGAGGSFSSTTDLNATYTASGSSGTPVTLTLNTTGGACGSTSANKQVVVNPRPVVTTTTPAAICGGATTSIPLTASVASTYIYTLGTVTGVTGASACASACGTSIAQTLTNNGATAGSVTYNIIATNGTCTSVATPIIQTVNPRPVMTVTTPAAICSGSPTAINLAAMNSTTSTYTWTVGTITGSITGATACAAACGSTIAQTLNDPSPSASGSVIYNVIPTSTTGSCVGSAVGITQTVNPIPDVSSFATSAASPCVSSGSTVTITSSTLANGTGYTVNYTLSGANTGTFNAAMTYGVGTGTFIIAGANLGGAGATTVTINSVTIIAGGCSVVVVAGNVANFNVNRLPSPFTASVSPNPVCAGGAITLSGTATGASGVTYQWNGPLADILTPTSLNASIASAVVGDAGTYTLVATAAGCGSTSATTSALVVNRLPSSFTAVAAPNPVCVGTAVTLTGSGTGASGVSYSWSGPIPANITTPTSLSAGIAAASLGDAGVYTITATAAACGSTQAMTSALVTNARPVASFLVAPSANNCEGNSVTYTTQSGRTNYLWSVPGVNGLDYTITSGGTSTTHNSVTLTWLTFGTKVVTVNYTDGNGCTSASPASNSTTVSTNPTAHSVTGGGTYCTGGTGLAIGLNGSEVGINYRLYRGVTPVGSDVAGTGGSISFGLQTVPGTYTALATNTVTTCSSNMTSFATIATTPPPTAFTLSGTGSYCAGGAGLPINLSNTELDVTYQLYVGVTPVPGGVITGTGSPMSFGLQTTGGVYSAVANPGSGPGCETSMTGSPVITVNPQPGAIGGTPTVCVNGVTTLTNGGTGTWSSNNTSLATVVTSTGAVTGVAAGSPVITFTLSSSGCQRSITVTVNPLPNAITGATSVCTGLTTTLSNAGVGTWASGNVLVATVGSSTGVVSGVTSGTSDVTFTLASTGCARSTVVTVNQTPPAITGTTAVCVNSNITLSNDGAGTWNSSNVALATVGLTTGVVGGVAAGSPVISYTYPVTGCRTTATVTVNPLPTAITGGNSVCVNGTLALTSPGGGAWSSSTPTVATVDPSTGVVTGVLAGSTTITYTLGTGCYTTLAVTVNPLPGSVSGATSVCVNGTTTLTAAGGGTWSSSNNLLATVNSSTGVVTGVAAGAPNIIYTLPLTGCTRSTAVTVNPLPNNIGGVLGVCIGSTTQLSNAGGGTWTSSNTSMATIDLNTGLLGGVSAGNPTVTYTLPSTGCRTTATVAVSALPTAIIGGPATVCIGSTVSLSNSGSGVWSSSNSSFATVSATGVVSAAAAGSATINYTSGAGCVASTVITVNARPTLTGVTPSTVFICTGTPLSFTAAGATGTGALTSYNWAGPNSYFNTTTVNTNTLTPASTLASGLYSVTVTYPGVGCTSLPQATAAITVSAAPALTSASNNGPICVGDQLVLTANGATNVTTYSWAGPVAFTGGAATASATITPTTGAAAGNYTVTVSNAGGTGCTARYTTTGVVNALPTTPTVSGAGGPFCGSTTITASNGGSGTIYFQGTNATGTSIATPSVLQVVGATGTYHFRALSAGGCWSAPGAGAAVTINPLPTAFAITGGGSYCSGGTGVNICLAGSESGVTYQLYEGAFTSGSTISGPGVICFGLRTNPGTYTVIATRTATGCTNNMTGSTTIAVTPVPNAYNVIGGGSYCSGGAGVAVGLNNSDAGVSYQLYNNGVAVGSLVTGTGSPITFGPQTSAGSYSVVANPSATCATPMTNGITVTITTPPTAFNVSGSGSYCPGSTGLHVLLSGSQLLTNYQLYKDGVASGSTVAGTNGALDFGLQTAGTYAIVATSSATSCTNTMTGTAVITTSALPTVFATTGGGGYCSGGTGVAIGLANSTTGVNYVLYNSAGGSTSAVGGNTGNPITFGLQTTAGTYTVIATNATTFCTSMMTGNPVITITATPQLHNVVGGGNQCAGGLGFDIGVDGSEAGVSYQLYRNSIAIGSPVTGTGSAVDLGLQTLAGTYTVKANPGTNCEVTMTGSTVINIVALPNAFTVTGGGTYCTGGSGFHVGVNGSESNVNYQLYKDGSPVGVAVAGGSGSIDFGVLMSAGTYKVIGTSTVTGCSRTMTDSAVIIFYPTALTHTVTGGGQYCEGGTGVDIGLDGSEVGVTYQLYRAGLPVGTLVSGTGLSISFGNQTIAGQYAVVANPASTCAATMTNSVTVTMNAKPTQYNVTGTGSYCAGGTGLAVGLSGSNTGISYQLYRNGVLLGSAVLGTNGSLNFGLQTAAGTYTVLATNSTTGCQNNMSGQAVITVNAAPTVYSVTGGGGYCTGGSGVHVGLSGSTSGIKYQLYNGVIPQGIALTGTGSALDFGLITLGGTYTVIAQDPVTLCTANMSGATAVVANSLPTAYTASGSGSFCAGGAGIHIILSNSTTGVNYQLYNGSGAVGTPVAGVNGSLDFGAITTGGTYTVVATNGTTGCQNNMTGNPVITVNPLPTIQSVNGGGAYCQGGTGVLVGLANSQSGVTYTLMRGATIAGSVVSTGGAFNFALQTTAGTYTVLATTGAGCSAVMSGLAVVTMNALPTAYTVSGTGAYCSGGTGLNVTLSGSATGINYQLYNGGATVSTPMPGTGFGLNFGPQIAAGTYTVQATNTTTGCTNIMAGSAVITVNATPALATVTGGGQYCAGGTGVHIGLTNPTTSGISYQLVNGSGSVGAPIVSTGGAIDFGLITAAGTYSVIASNTVTGCSATMSGNATVTVNPLPQIYTVSGGGVYCAGGNGFSITTNGSNLGINYQLMLGGSPVGGATAGTGSGLNFGAQTAPGAYTVVATNATTGCSVNMSGTATISVNVAPTVFAMTGGGSYCSGGTGVALGLAGSTLGVSYQLYNGSTLVTTVAGTNSAISFGSLTAAGTYTVTAVNSITGCQSPMSGFKTITINALPLVYTVSGTGSYCQGGAGVAVVMNNSESTVNYQLYVGATMVGSPVQGVNGPLSFGPQMTGGVYTVIGTNISTGCTSNMAGSATITVNPLPTMYTVTGGGNYCQGGTGVQVGLNASNTGINYKLYNGATLMGSMNGTGSGFNFGLQTAVGTYTVLATNSATGCSTVMSGVATVGTNALPGAQLVTGGGNYCSNDAGVAISLANSISGINYQLYRGSTPVGLPLAGVNGPLSFPLQTVVGTYSVTASDATTGCSMGMTGGATVGINLAPTLFTVTGGGNYCQGGSGMLVGLSSSTTGVEYELFLNGSSTGITASGNGSPINFGLQTAVGTYSVNARNLSTNCSIGMSGFAVVGINNLPNVYTILGAASTYCQGGAGINMILNNSQVGVNYQLINGSVAIGFAVPGTGTQLDFGNQTVAGTYIVQATNATTGCSTYMASSASVVISPLPTIYTVTGGGGYCAGTAGASVGLSSSNTGITYKLYRGVTQVDSRSGTGSPIDFGPQTTGAYTVVASNNTTTCSSNMAGGANVTVNALPAMYNVTGGGNYCAGGTGVPVGLSNSQTGVNYQLYNGTLPVGFPVPGTTGSPITFGAQTGTGSYTVMGINASTNCGVAMTGAVTIGTNVTPDVFTVTGGGHFCNGGSGVNVGLSNSTAGIRYQLYNGITLVSTMMGTGSSLNFGAQATAGSYAAVATNTVTGCSSNMSGTPAVTIDPLPTVFLVGGGGNYCAGGSGVAITLSSSHTGINYQLYNGSSTAGFPVAGTGAALSLGMQTAVGTYSVMATNASTGCMMGMAGSATVGITSVVTPAVTISSGASDSVCAGVPKAFTAMTVNGGTSPTYSWTVNGSATGVSGAVLTYMPTNGDIIAVTMTSNAACATPATVNDAMVVSVLPIGAPSVNVTADPGNQVCEGSSVTFTAAPTLGGTAPVYYWVRNTTVVGTGSTFNYTPNDNDVVYCMMVSNYTCRTIDTVFSNTTRMEVDPPVVPTITITADPGVKVHPNTEVTLTAVVTNAGTAPTYQWYIGSSAIPGATGPTLTSANFNTGDSITCVVTSSSACKLSAFNSVVMTVFPVGVNQVSLGNSDIKLMPNPNKGWFTVKGTLGVTTDEEVTLEVTNMLGQTVFANKVIARNGSIDERIELGSNLANGMYMLNLKTQNGNKVFHIVVEQ